MVTCLLLWRKRALVLRSAGQQSHWWKKKRNKKLFASTSESSIKRHPHHLSLMYTLLHCPGWHVSGLLQLAASCWGPPLRSRVQACQECWDLLCPRLKLRHVQFLGLGVVLPCMWGDPHPSVSAICLPYAYPAMGGPQVGVPSLFFWRHEWCSWGVCSPWVVGLWLVIVFLGTRGCHSYCYCNLYILQSNSKWNTVP